MILVRIEAGIPGDLPSGRRWHADPTHPSFAGSGSEALREDEVGPDDVILVPDDPMTRLRTIVRLLLSPHGCPWDREQTHASLRGHLIEEAHEAAAAIDSGDLDALREELGDVLLQPILHAAIAARRGDFDLDDVATRLADKLERRHPHVFGDSGASTTADVLRQWDRLKKEEGDAPKALLEGIPRATPALVRALAISRRAARAGFEWPDREGVFAKLDEEIAELREAIVVGDPAAIEGEIGDLLFTAVNLARWSNVDPEAALARMLDRFQTRFSRMEAEDDTPLSELSAEAWDARWRRAKEAEA